MVKNILNIKKVIKHVEDEANISGKSRLSTFKSLYADSIFVISMLGAIFLLDKVKELVMANEMAKTIVWLYFMAELLLITFYILYFNIKDLKNIGK